MSSYDQPLSDRDLALLMMRHGIVCRTKAEEDELEQRIKAIGYYRLEEYTWPFRKLDPRDPAKRTPRFGSKMSFAPIWNTYLFDRRLRVLLMDALERFEIAIKNAVTQTLVMQTGSNTPQTNSALLPGFATLIRYKGKKIPKGEKWFKTLQAAFDGSPDPRMKHCKNVHKTQKVEDLPLWILMDLATFGDLKTLYESLRQDLKNALALSFGVTEGFLTASIMLLHLVRNRCAHHKRLWNFYWVKNKNPLFPGRHFDAPWHMEYDAQVGRWTKRQSTSLQSFDSTKTAFAFILCGFWMDKLAPTSRWKTRVENTVQPSGKMLKPACAAGFCDGWEKHPLWRNYDLSVVTVCLNVLPDVRRTVESVLAHKGKGALRIEHVVVDGASADGTPGYLAQLKAAGGIEAYVSEPDKGIYDAMNKGIGLCHGKAVVMLNAGDTFLGETDLADYVLPIVRGETECVYGAWRVEGQAGLKHPCPQGGFIITPCCHQSFFLSRAAYRRVGGYDTAMRCLADGHLMWRVHSAGIRAKVVNKPVILFQPGGLSADPVRFMHEQVATWHEHLAEIVAKARANRDYARFAAAYYCSRCGMVAHYCRTGGKYPGQLLQQLGDIGTALAAGAGMGFYTTRLLRHIVTHWLPAWRNGGQAGRAATLLFHLRCLGLPSPQTEPYRSMGRILPLARRLAQYSRSPYKEVFDYPCTETDEG